MTDKVQDWYYDQIKRLDPKGAVVTADRESEIVSYSETIRSDESRQRPATAEELVRALALVLLCGDGFRYPWRPPKLPHSWPPQNPPSDRVNGAVG